MRDPRAFWVKTNTKGKESQTDKLDLVTETTPYVQLPSSSNNPICSQGKGAIERIRRLFGKNLYVVLGVLVSTLGSIQGKVGLYQFLVDRMISGRRENEIVNHSLSGIPVFG